jgi:hypothetical protein
MLPQNNWTEWFSNLPNNEECNVIKIWQLSVAPSKLDLHKKKNYYLWLKK